MTQRQTSPADQSRGTQETKRIVLTRGELIKIISQFLDEVKEAKEFPAFLDTIFAEAERGGAIIFDREAPIGRRIKGA